MAEAEAKGFMFIFDGWFCLTCTTFDEGYKTKLDTSGIRDTCGAVQREQ